MSRFWKIALIVIAVIVVVAVGFRLLHKPAAEAGAHGASAAASGQGKQGASDKDKDKDAAPVPVTVEPVVKQNVPVYLTALGTVQALNTVTINPQVARPDAEHQLQGRPGGEEGRPAGADRSAHLPGRL